MSDSFVTLWTIARQAPLSMGFSRQEYWSGLPCRPPGDLPNPGIEPVVKNPSVNAEDSGSVSGWGRSPGEGNEATHSSILAWEIPWIQEPGGLQSMGLQKSDTT